MINRTDATYRSLDREIANLVETKRRIIAIVPRMLTYFGTAPERYEVTDYWIIWEEEK